MKTYIVTFDIDDTSENDRIVEYLKRHENVRQIHRYCWAINTALSAVDLRNAINNHVPVGASVFVVRSGVEAAWRNSYGQNTDDWLKQRL